MGIKIIQSTLFSSLAKPFLSRGWSRDRRPLSLLLLTAAAVVGLGATAPAQADSLALAQAEAVVPVADRYLFGQTAEPDQVGQGYVVLERAGDRVYGALYFPSSSFDCFSGRVQGTELAMNIINSYDQETYTYSLALADGPVVAASDTTGELAPFNLSGFQSIDTLSANDHRMLAICRNVVAPAQ